MAVDVRSSSNTGWATVNDVTVPKPTGLAVGDLMFFFLSTNGNNVSDANLSGWTYLGYQNGVGSAFASYLAYKFADSSDVAASNFTWNDIDSGTTSALGLIVAVYGNNNLTSLISTSVTTTNTTSNTSTPSLSGITPSSRGNNLIIQFWNGGSSVASVDSYAIATSNPTWTELADVSSAGRCVAVAYAVRPEVTATGNFSCVGGDGTSDWNGWVVSVAPDQNFSVAESVTLTESYKNNISVKSADSISLNENYDLVNARQWTNDSKPSTTWTNDLI